MMRPTSDKLHKDGNSNYFKSPTTDYLDGVSLI